jgi:predicted metal-binding membrane protein
MMNLAWMALVSVAIFSEKVLPIGRVAAIVIATLLILAGLALLAAPASVVV